MDTNVVSELISTVGFPITCVIALSYFAFYFTNTNFSLSIGSAIGTATKVFVILEYTKTTD